MATISTPPTPARAPSAAVRIARQLTRRFADRRPNRLVDRLAGRLRPSRGASSADRIAGALVVWLRRLLPALAIICLVLAMNGRWMTSSSAHAAPAAEADAESPPAETKPRRGKKAATGKVNLNTATEEQLMRLPTVGPAKAERIVAWRKRHGGFKRIADLRRVKGFGYKTFKRLEPLLAIRGETTLE